LDAEFRVYYYTKILFAAAIQNTSMGADFIPNSVYVRIDFENAMIVALRENGFRLQFCAFHKNQVSVNNGIKVALEKIEKKYCIFSYIYGY
jgi:hypothetical protein